MIRIGQKFRDTRLRKGLTLTDVSVSTKIRKEFLEAIEEGDYSKIPSAYAYGFVRNYISFLGLPEQEMLALFRREFDEEKIYKVLPTGLTTTSFSLSKRSGTVLLIALLFIFLSFFILFQYRDALINPKLEITTPKDFEIFYTSDITVSGKTDPENVVYIQNFLVSPDNEGNFKKIISLFEGKVELTIKVVNRFNRETQVKRRIEIKSS